MSSDKDPFYRPTIFFLGLAVAYVGAHILISIDW